MRTLTQLGKNPGPRAEHTPAPGRAPRRRATAAVALALMVVPALAALVGGASAGAASTGTGSHRAGASAAQGTADCGRAGCVTVVQVSGLIDPLVADSIVERLDEAAADDELVGVVLQLDSPGVVLTDEQFTALARRLDRFPENLSVWVGPSGAGAVGGAAELLAVVSDTSMAPGSTVTFQPPQRLDATEFGDLLPDDPQLLGEPVEAEDAAEAELVAATAPVLVDALGRLDWFETKVVTGADGERRREPVTVVRFAKLALPQQLLHTAASPAVAYLAFIIGLGLLLFEFYTAGVGVAGVVGAVSLLLGSYGLGVLPVRTWAVAAVVASMVAFAVDVQTGIPRFWAGVGMAAFALGSLFLFDGVPRPWIALAAGLVGMASTMFSGMPSMVRARFGTPTIGRTWMIGEVGEVTEAVDPDGMVRISGAQWLARTNRATPLAVGDRARVVEVDGLLLEVEPEAGGAKDYRELRGSRMDHDPDGS
ncbi:MAG: NfeD family protein [Microthrixaceae bacterium]